MTLCKVNESIELKPRKGFPREHYDVRGEYKVPKKPNILFLMSDQHRADFTGYEGHNAVRTPTLDWLASTGAVFTNAYTPSPICIPGRQCIMAGQYPRTCNVQRYGEDLAPNYMTFSRALSQYGYATVCAGKIHHAGTDQMQGWTHRLGWWDMEVYRQYIEGVVEEEERQYMIEQKFWSLIKEIKMSGPGYSPYARNDDYSVQGALHFIEEYFCDGVYDKHEPNRPLLLKVSLQQPHYPYIANNEKYTYYLNRVKPFERKQPIDHPMFSGDWAKAVPEENVSTREITRALAAYCAMIETCDDHYNKVIKALEHVGQDIDDWIIVYTSDHGDMMGEYDLWWKLKFYEGSARVPLIIRAPEYFKGGQRIKANVNLIDLFATFCDLAGIPIPQGLDSRSLVPLLNGDSSGWDNETASQINGDRIMIKRDSLKYMYFGEGIPEVLFDLERNPEETVNYIADSAYGDKIAGFRKRRMELGF